MPVKAKLSIRKTQLTSDSPTASAKRATDNETDNTNPLSAAPPPPPTTNITTTEQEGSSSSTPPPPAPTFSPTTMQSGDSTTNNDNNAAGLEPVEFSAPSSAAGDASPSAAASANGDNNNNNNNNDNNNAQKEPQHQSDAAPAAAPQTPPPPPAAADQQDDAAAAATPAPVVVTMNDLAASVKRGYPDNFIKTSKYTVLSFVPMNLIDQFKKVSNFYFLVNMIVALIPGVSPITPFTAVLPLVFVIGVALIKDGYEEYVRHRADAEANSIVAHVVRENKETGQYELTDVQSRDVQVGDIMYIKNGEEIRADVLLLSSTGPESSSFIETCNLDGETNLKNRKAVPETWGIKSVDTAVAADLEVITGQPSPQLLHWTGVLTTGGKEVSVGLDQFLYRSSILKNTEEAWGVVLYAGVDTKMFRNLEEKPPKMSGLDVKLNWLILAVLGLQISILITLSSISVAFNESHDSHWYMKPYLTRQSGIELWGFRFLTYFILMSYLIPISLFVTLELCKVAQATLMEWDHEMFEWMHGKWQHCTANTSNLNEQLSQVKFIFSDKTGTLTENVMKYRLGDALGLPIDSENFEATNAQMKNDERMQRYMRALALCHTIQPFDDTDAPSGLKYDGASPDEIALVETAVAHGVELRERFTRSMKLRLHHEENATEQDYEILATLEFTPDRKMMSIVIKNPITNKIEIYTKGADSFVMPRLNEAANAENLPHATARLKEMAGTGLRTLMVCYREVSESEFAAWNERFIEAGKALENRSKIVDEVCLELEKELLMVGITAIEDKLQDKVPETIQFFLEAGVVIWMLTGDKRETALTIAETSSLANRETDYIDHIDIGDRKPDDPEAQDIVSQQLHQVAAHCAEETKKVTFVIDGPALSIAMNQKNRDIFIEISQKVSSAVCCRLTPLQKANVVHMFQHTTGLTALAIGDGANDVPMISEGKVGVGIVGLEGAQAALAADYAIPRFKHLKRLCCVHGRYSLVRNAFCIFVSFYKNFVMTLTQFYYAFFAGYSGMTLYDGWLLSFYNFAFTSVPPLIIGMFEKDMPEKGLMKNPYLFPMLADGIYFNTKLLLAWFGEGLWHSLILYFVVFPMLLGLDVGHRQISGEMVGSLLMTCIVGLVLLKLSFHVSYWQWIIFAGIAFSVVFYIAFILCYSLISNLFGSTAFYWTLFILMKDPKFWLYLFFFFVGLLIPFDLAFIFIQKHFFPTALDKIERRYQDREDLLSAGSMSMSLGNLEPAAPASSSVAAEADPASGSEQQQQSTAPCGDETATTIAPEQQ